MSGAAAARVSSIPAWRSRHRPYRPQTFQLTIRIVVSTTGPYGSHWLKPTAPVWRGGHSRPEARARSRMTAAVSDVHQDEVWVDSGDVGVI
jgi:hypothetical protein